MKTAFDLKDMPREEKLRMMEALWEDLSREEAEITSPAWHGSALKDTEQKYESGTTESVDWDTAKNELRSRFK